MKGEVPWHRIAPGLVTWETAFKPPHHWSCWESDTWHCTYFVSRDLSTNTTCKTIHESANGLTSEQRKSRWVTHSYRGVICSDLLAQTVQGWSGCWGKLSAVLEFRYTLHVENWFILLSCVWIVRCCCVMVLLPLLYFVHDKGQLLYLLCPVYITKFKSWLFCMLHRPNVFRSFYNTCDDSTSSCYEPLRSGRIITSVNVAIFADKEEGFGKLSHFFLLFLWRQALQIHPNKYIYTFKDEVFWAQKFLEYLIGC